MPLSLDALQVKMETIEKDLNEVKENVKQILDKFDNLDERYTTRRETEVIKEEVSWLKWNQNKLVRTILTLIIWAVVSLILIK